MREKLTYVFCYTQGTDEKHYEYIDAYSEFEAMREFYKIVRGYGSEPVQFEIKTWVDFCPNLRADRLTEERGVALV